MSSTPRKRRHIRLSIFIVSVVLAAMLPVTRAADQPSSESPAQLDARMAWWRDARFGMFIHFGLYSIPGHDAWHQWNNQIPVEEYARLADQFKPDFKPDDWAATAKAAGMKYMVLTSRHHDGFALFDDGTNQFTTTKTAAHRDLVADYVKAVRKAGLHVGLYYSPLDWRFPGFFFPNLYLSNAVALREQYHRQMRELMSNYGQVDLLWFDGGESDWLSFGHVMSDPTFPKLKTDEHYHGQFSWQGAEVNEMMRRLQPQIIVNNRAADVPPDYTSRENYVGDFDNEHPWEMCTTLTASGTWGFEPNANLRSLQECVQMLVKVAGRDGNLLLNVGPRPDGQIDPPQAQRLSEIGEWLGKYGESIYATRGGPFQPGDYGVSTHRGNKIYVHVLKWPDDKLMLPAIPAKIVRASVLAGGEANFTQTDSQIELSVADNLRDATDTILVLEMNHPVSGIKPVAFKN